MITCFKTIGYSRQGRNTNLCHNIISQKSFIYQKTAIVCILTTSNLSLIISKSSSLKVLLHHIIFQHQLSQTDLIFNRNKDCFNYPDFPPSLAAVITSFHCGFFISSYFHNALLIHTYSNTL